MRGTHAHLDSHRVTGNTAASTADRRQAESPFEGFYLCRHSAMATHGVPGPEADFARRAREVVGRACRL
ncbi:MULTISPECIES: M81 family metallopeptidase [unclassified Bradyrhizobium]|uniref:M81 family metallopeptidase n=1 Tax=unclassified Bradyrhizobium TaxID=2631580 RepID=UPI001FF7E1BC|nr:M81 family metallopeptidase [Bradyrhizobium sp. 163]MCK1760032.1 M81 family metallopeptidase [Bradyrhizobium sp. 136]